MTVVADAEGCAVGAELGCAGGVVRPAPPWLGVASGVVATGTGTTAVASALGRAALPPGLGAPEPRPSGSPGWCRAPA
ncbi:hypothetical protein SAMN05414137_103501 [Streptacidiphilus jiangxiensis]|uniref:Uncharacterized protein n=1 Tax=Streptacidiphilus jiangxiensis TaxID=235985 RepID=A0A1H7JY90_STRJI|nr:hypothetical protein SAMN05414137_103501 [Streptacidiphilus jiangxiensis]